MKTTYKHILSSLLGLLIISSYSANALELSVDAYGKTRELARKQAYASLSESLLVEVKSTFKSRLTSAGKSDASQDILTSSELPLLGVNHTTLEKGDEFYCTAVLNSNKSLKLYKNELDKLYANMVAINKQRSGTDNKKSYTILSELLTTTNKYNKYQTVYRLLGGKNSKVPPASSSEIRSDMLSIEADVPSLSIAAKVLTRNLPADTYFVHAALPHGSKQATRFSRILRSEIENQIKTTSSIKSAQYHMKGSYELLKNGLAVTYRVVDNEGATLATRLVKLSPNAYNNIDHKPTSIDFDRLLHEGYVVSSDFRAELNSSSGKNDLLFLAGESIELFAKLNSPGYFYVVSHNTTDGTSYLLELNETSGKRAFVRYVNADDANRWISLGEFEVTEPFGTENLQLLASNTDLIDKLPGIAFDKKTGLYVMKAKSIKDAVITTRGLKPKRKNKVKSAEAALTFTTMKQ